MYFFNLYFSLIKNKINYNIIYFNKKKNIWVTLNMNWLKSECQLMFIKMIKHFSYENGVKFLYSRNWYQYGLRYNIIQSLNLKSI